jgi:hypothetical protein
MVEHHALASLIGIDTFEDDNPQNRADLDITDGHVLLPELGDTHCRERGNTYIIDQERLEVFINPLFIQSLVSHKRSFLRRFYVSPPIIDDRSGSVSQYASQNQRLIS